MSEVRNPLGERHFDQGGMVRAKPMPIKRPISTDFSSITAVKAGTCLRTSSGPDRLDL